MKYFLDTEFEPNTLELVSIGLVNEAKQIYYAELFYNRALVNANPWLVEHVLPQLAPISQRYKYTQVNSRICEDLTAFTGTDTDPQFIAYYGAYDWVLLHRLFESAGFPWPINWPHWYIEIKHLMQIHNFDKANLPPKLEPQHNALIDAQWGQLAYELITGHYKPGDHSVLYPH